MGKIKPGSIRSGSFRKEKKMTKLAIRRRTISKSKSDKEIHPETPSDYKFSNIIIPKASLNYLMHLSASHKEICNNCDLKIADKGIKYLHISCSTCKETFAYNLDDEKANFNCNEALCWGLYLSGSTYEQVKNLFTSMQIRIPSFPTFQNLEDRLLMEFRRAKEILLKRNGEEARAEALDGQETENPIGITVVVDGSWSKRSYKHSYNSQTGMALVIDEKTKKVLHIDTRNLYCRKCNENAKSGNQVDHDCTRNHTGSSQRMESDIIVDGFENSIKMHNLMYRNVIGDGDSSVYHEILSRVRYPDIVVHKFECVNHVVKNVKKDMITISNDKMHDLESRKLLKKNIERIGTAVASAILHNHNNQNKIPSTNVQTLREDLINIPLHIFGSHAKCKQYFCQKDQNEHNWTVALMKRLFWVQIRTSFDNLANKSNRLIQNKTSNLCEGFNAQIAKYIQGKRLNNMQKHGYEIRVLSALFAYQFGPFWLSKIYEIIQSQQVPTVWSNLSQQYRNKNDRNIKYKENKKESEKLKSRNERRKKILVSDGHYGQNSKAPDVDLDVLNQMIYDKVDQLQVNETQRDEIELDTRDQSESANDIWFIQRRERITASKAGRIFSLQDATNNSATIKEILYTQKPIDFKYDDHRARGLRQEPFAREVYQKIGNVRVEKCGLFVSLDNGIFAASPDGLVGDDGIIEIKCTSQPPSEIPSRKSDRFLMIDKKNKMILKRNHKYFYQVALQLYCTGRKWCDFVIYYKNEQDEEDGVIWIERIFESEISLMLSNLLDKLEKFYLEDLAPEIVDPRYTRSMGIRQPAYRCLALEEKTAKKAEKMGESKIVNEEEEEEELE